MKKNIFKKAGRVFTSLALAVSICLTMSVSVFAKNGNDLENKNINYRDYLYFVIDGKDYKMTDLTTEPGVDLSGSNVSAEVYAKVDMDGLNAAMKASGSKDTFVLHKNTYMSRYEKSTEPIVYNFHFQAHRQVYFLQQQQFRIVYVPASAFSVLQKDSLHFYLSEEFVFH